MSETRISDTAFSSFNLADLSERDKPWDIHKANSCTVSGFYASTDEFQGYAVRVQFCSQLLEFLFTQAPGVLLNLKLEHARFCRVRSCPVCQWRRSLMWKSKAHKILPRIVKAYPNHRWLFLTLTVRNCAIADLRITIADMHKSFQRLVNLKSFPAVGWIKSLEVTRNQHDNSAHPHFHCLLMVKPGYFGGTSYIKQSEWVQLWRRSLRVDYDPVVDIQALKKSASPSELIPELLKYCTKESDLIADKEWFLELTRQMHKQRTIATGGVLKQYLKELESEPQDLIGESDDPDNNLGNSSLHFQWHCTDKKYKLTD